MKQDENDEIIQQLESIMIKDKKKLIFSRSCYH